MRILYLDCFLGFDAKMLLGALIDAGANPERLENKLAESAKNVSLYVQNTVRSSIDCKKADIIFDSKEECEKAYSDFSKSILGDCAPSNGTDHISIMAVTYAIELLEIEYIISSEISLNEGTDGKILEMFETSGIRVFPSDGSIKNMEPADALFLTNIVNESGPKPSMEVLSIGYGAGGNDPDKPDLITAIIGEFDSNALFEEEIHEELTAYL